MSRFRYPVDTDQFQRIREDGKVYVFLARPRRFGKSLLYFLSNLPQIVKNDCLWQNI